MFAEGGGSETCLFQDGKVFEKAGINFAKEVLKLSADFINKVHCF